MASKVGLIISSPKSFPQPYGLSGPTVGKMRLLVIYIHGFIGSEESFGQFPSHVHSFLQQALRNTHVVCSKIYPQYETRNAMDIAVENFSHWLQSHENAQTDVILVGHSLGGILASQVALLEKSPNLAHQPRRRILGTISLDCPFLGLNPGIIIPGIISLFRPKAQVEANPRYGESAMLVSQHSSSSRLLPSNSPVSAEDKGFNPPFFNDNDVWSRGQSSKPDLVQSFWINLREKINFYLSHWTYGRCLRRPWSLKLRYYELRALEYSSKLPPRYEKQDVQAENSGRRPEIRFLNFFTASTPGQSYQKLKNCSPGLRDADKKLYFEQSGEDYRLGYIHIENDFDSGGTEVEPPGHKQSGADMKCLQQRTTMETTELAEEPVRLYQPLHLLQHFLTLLMGLVGIFWFFSSLFQGGGTTKPKKGRTFCLVPPVDDPTWVRISMEGTDEIGAHCSLFVGDGPHYERLVLRMGKEIVQWVHDDNGR